MVARPMQRKQKSPSWLFLVVFFFFVFGCLTLFSSGFLDSEDGWLYATVARNIYYRHEITSAPYEYPEKNVHMNTSLGKDGKWHAPGSLGYSFSLVPAVALSDMVHNYYRATPPEHFPLQHDWSFDLFASFTNAAFGALLATFILLYARTLFFSSRASVLIALLTIGTTNLLPLTKFSFPQMMFTAFLVGSFYFIKKLGQTQQVRFLGLAGLSYLIVVFSYNNAYFLPIIPLGVYLLLLEKAQQRRLTVVLALGAISSFVIFRTPQFIQLLSSFKISLKILFEGIWGFVFSSGKSIFLYSPPLLILPFFWHKLKKSLLPEIIAFTLLVSFYLFFYGSACMTDHNAPVPIWHGGMAWGTRYIAPLIPFLMLLVFHILIQFNKRLKILIAVPLFLIGIWVQLIGVSISYLLQYRDLPYSIFINKTEISFYDYGSFIPRFSPLLTLSREFIRKISTFKPTIDHGKYAVRFFDGFDIPYHAGNEIFRGFREEGHISLTSPTNDPIKSINLMLFNAPDTSTSSATAVIKVTINDQPISTVTMPARKDIPLQLDLSNINLTQQSILSFYATYATRTVTPHVVYIKNMLVNGQTTNLASLDYPDLSTLGIATTPMPYRYLGNKVKDNWKFWDMRARINELTFDFWWIKNLYYWDRPQQFIWTLFIGNLALVGGTFILLSKHLRQH